MRTYTDAALRRLLDLHTTTSSFGHDVEVKMSTEDERPGLLDPYLLEAMDADKGRAKELGIPTGRFRLLLKLLLRPEKFMIDMRHLATDLVLSADADTTVDLTRRPIEVSHEELTLHEHPVKLWKYSPTGETTEPRPAFLHLHGGGFFAGVPTGRDNSLKFIADQADAVVFDLDYSLSPEVKFPHAVHETYAAVQHIREHARDYGIDPDRIVVGGGSAGGNLTAAATQLERRLGTSTICAQVLIAPALLLGQDSPPDYLWNEDEFVVDNTMRQAVGPIIDPARDRSIRTMTKVYRGASTPADPLMSPAMEPDLSGLPPALVITCEMDSLRPHGEFYAARLAAHDVPVRTLRYRGIMHATPAMFGVVPAAEAIAHEIIGVLRPDKHAPSPTEPSNTDAMETP